MTDEQKLVIPALAPPVKKGLSLVFILVWLLSDYAIYFGAMMITAMFGNHNMSDRRFYLSGVVIGAVPILINTVFWLIPTWKLWSKQVTKPVWFIWALVAILMLSYFGQMLVGRLLVAFFRM